MTPEDVESVTKAVLERLARINPGFAEAASPLGVLIGTDVPLGVEFQPPVVGEYITIEIFPRAGFFHIDGVRSFNEPGDIEVDSVVCGPHRIEQNANSFDSASYSLTHGAFSTAPVEKHLAFYRVPWGVISRNDPLVVTFRSNQTCTVSPPLRWTLYGSWYRDSPRMAHLEVQEKKHDS